MLKFSKFLKKKNSEISRLFGTWFYKSGDFFKNIFLNYGEQKTQKTIYKKKKLKN
jgi:hypothetical protein